MRSYDHKKIEKKWQKIWEKDEPYKVEDKSSKPKYYLLVEFPYPSGDGLHTGHVRSYTALDVVARKRRAEGYNVFYPIGWDAFGLPTENYAVKTKTPPRVVTEENTKTFRRQLKSLGLSFDWSREINTTDPAYYKWTQWIFLQFFKHGLAYKKKMPINWCVDCKIGLANEEVVDEACERCGGRTEKREKEQWMLAITKYADRLYDDLDGVDYPERVKIQQRNWIGRSFGAEIEFNLQPTTYLPAEASAQAGNLQPIRVFTTRPDTLFGATYMVLAPDHEIVQSLKSKIKNWEEAEKYLLATKKKTEIERTAGGKEKTGVELKGIRAINPANKEEIPVWVADYVLKDYGTGAIMAVPAHDERDYEFAKKFNLPIRKVIEPVFMQTTEPGKVIESEPFEERQAIIAIVKHWSEEKYIALKWKGVAWTTFITGGIENGLTAEESARAEVREETGYLNLKLVGDFGTLHGKFYHVPKKVNRFAHARAFLFQLKDDAQQEISEKEKELHDVVWLNKSELGKVLTPDSHRRALEIMNGKEVYIGEGIMANSAQFNGLDSEEAKTKITEFVGGKMKTTYKLRDWVFSRQRYWGEPIPLVFCEHCAGEVNKLNKLDKLDKGETLNPGWVAVPEEELPVELPEVKAYTPTDTGESPLAKVDSWVKVKCPKCGGPAKRETDTMPNWAGSSWYYLRYTDPHNDKALADKKKLEYWLPVNWYNGGMEHTTLHLLYSRFWHKFLFDIGAAPGSEPYAKRTSHGLVLAEGGEKMSKSKGNVVSPDSIVKTFGADTLRLYELFIGPFEQAVAWNEKGIIGPRRFLERVWRMEEKVGNSTAGKGLESVIHQTIKKVSEDIETLGFNTAVSALMVMGNEMDKENSIPKKVFETFLRLLAPFAPHVAEELWQELGHGSSVHNEPWPKYDETKLAGDTRTIVIQINGKVRGSFMVSAGVGEEEIRKTALAHEATAKWLTGKDPRQVIYVPGRLINFVL